MLADVDEHAQDSRERITNPQDYLQEAKESNYEDQAFQYSHNNQELLDAGLMLLHQTII